ncbi:GGDEF domain-containing protein [Pseudomonas sp. TTU2014-080ASC]|uniref:GGDEF domain-containing protein n=1 Tax=Pseudomonas sp. TTU2014-080ASC TaxID=1729724 RepID=UPI000B0F71B1|nr:GGDEF domain-containing protein [Pseudomonas sp. TTU2014-080ASC]
MHGRSAMAGIYYLLPWPLIWLFSNDPQALMVPGLIGVAVSVTLFALHLRHQPPTSQSPQILKRWLKVQWALILSTALCWGVVNAAALTHDLFGKSEVIATLSTVAFSTAIVFNFGLRKLPVVLALLLLYVPPLISLAIDWREQYPLLVSLLAYASYLLLALRKSHRGYRRTIELEQQLLRQQEHLDQLSRTDGLTQLGNRYQFNSLFPNMVASAQRQNQPLSLVLLDIDHFKQINDVYGHACGDECLSAFAERMRLHFRRASDALLRLGGEEFGVLMPNTQLEHAQAMADQFRIELASSYFAVGSEQIVLTASVGVGCFELERDVTAAAFYKRVDDALYKAKNAGRNSLVTV